MPVPSAGNGIAHYSRYESMPEDFPFHLIYLDGLPSDPTAGELRSDFKFGCWKGIEHAELIHIEQAGEEMCATLGGEDGFDGLDFVEDARLLVEPFLRKKMSDWAGIVCPITRQYRFESSILAYTEPDGEVHLAICLTDYPSMFEVLELLPEEVKAAVLGNKYKAIAEHEARCYPASSKTYWAVQAMLGLFLRCVHELHCKLSLEGRDDARIFEKMVQRHLMATNITRPTWFDHFPDVSDKVYEGDNESLEKRMMESSNRRFRYY